MSQQSSRSTLARGKFFILGIGAQKCGTTWLEAQLSKTPFFTNGGIKEFHVFNKPYRGKSIGKKLSKRHKKGQENLLKTREIMRLSPRFYFNHFDYLYLHDQNISHVGDITPAYSTLDKERFEAIKAGLESKKFKIKLIFLMRDPVERVWSQLRMNNRLLNERKGKPRPSAQDEYMQLSRFYKTASCKKRTRYEEISATIESVFSKECIYYGFYENLFQQIEIDRLTDFLECPSMNPDFGKVLHASPKPSEHVDGMEELFLEIRNYYKNTYLWAQERFQNKTPASWTKKNHKS